MKLLHFLEEGNGEGSIREYVVLLDDEKPDISEWKDKGYKLHSISEVVPSPTSALPTDRQLIPE